MNDTTSVDVNENAVEDDLDVFGKDFFQTKTDNDANDSTGDDDDSPATEETTEEVKEEVTTEETNEEEESEDDISEETEEEKKNFLPKKKKTFQERINEVIAKQRELERELEAERAKNREVEKSKEQPKETTSPVLDKDAPTADDLNEDGTPKYPLGEFDPSYINDLTRHALERNRREMEEKMQQEQEARAVAEAQEALRQEWQGRVTEAEKTYEDFRESVGTLEQQFANIDPQYSEYLASTIMAMPQGADVLYYLSQNPDVASEIVTSGPARATIALGELHGMFKKQEKATIKKVSSAPEPPPTNKGRKVVREVPDDTDDLEAFEKKLFKRN